MTWIIKFIGSAALLLMFFGTLQGGHEPPVVTTTEQSNLASIARYVGDRDPSVVMVGSSLAFRISEEYFPTLKVNNLALAGGSSNTGLEIIEKEPALPKLVIIETNMIARPLDRDIITKFHQGPHSFARPVRLLAQKYEALLHSKSSRDRTVQRLNELVSAPPAPIGNQHEMARSQAASFPAFPLDSVNANLSEMKALVSDLEERGVKCVFLDVPMPPELNNAPFISEAKKRAMTEFPDRSSWLQLNLNAAELRWTDGAHLDQRSSVIVARAIETSAARLLSDAK